MAGLWFFTELSVPSSYVFVFVLFCFTILIYYYRDGKLYCDADYKRKFVPKCAKCQDYITSVSVPNVRTTSSQ